MPRIFFVLFAIFSELFEFFRNAFNYIKNKQIQRRFFVELEETVREKFENLSRLLANKKGDDRMSLCLIGRFGYFLCRCKFKKNMKISNFISQNFDNIYQYLTSPDGLFVSYSSYFYSF
jgi:hypothetical protein